MFKSFDIFFKRNIYTYREYIERGDYVIFLKLVQNTILLSVQVNQMVNNLTTLVIKEIGIGPNLFNVSIHYYASGYQ